MSDYKKQISKAPVPFTPLNPLPPKLSPFDTDVKGQTNWKHWRHVSLVELWQALLLSLNIEPPGNGWLLFNSVGGPGDIPRTYLDSNGLTEKFIRRSGLLCNRLESIYGHLEKVELTQFIKLSLFASWAIEFEWDNLPPELVEIAQSKKSENEVPPQSISGPHKSPRDSRPWEILPERFNAITDLKPIPGKIPRTGNGKLAVKAAWQLECETKKTATALEVMALLIEWAKSGEEPDLKVHPKTSHAVNWVTQKVKENEYDLEALGKTLGRWNLSRH